MSGGHDNCATCSKAGDWNLEEDPKPSPEKWRVPKPSFRDYFPQTERLHDFDWKQLIPSPFSAIEKTINESRRLLDLSKGWDDEDAEPVDESTWRRATNFLLRTVQAVYRRSRVVLPSPNISPCADGSIDLLWKARRFRLLINIQPEGKGESDFFGETPSGLKVKGTFLPEGREFGFIDWLATNDD